MRQGEEKNSQWLSSKLEVKVINNHAFKSHQKTNPTPNKERAMHFY